MNYTMLVELYYLSKPYVYTYHAISFYNTSQTIADEALHSPTGGTVTTNTSKHNVGTPNLKSQQIEA